MKMIEYFRSFLENEVNLNESRIALLDERAEAIATFLKGSATFADHFIDAIAQGSYAHKTIIRPVQENDEFDADLLLYLTEFEGWSPKDYVENVYTTFRSSGVYKDMVSRRTRCVVVNYAGDFHIDVVPYLERHGRKYITNRREDSFELTDPEGYNSWLDEKNRVASRHFVKVIRLLKYLRDYKGTFSVKSIIFNTLLGSQVIDLSLLGDEDSYADVPSTLRTVMNRLSAYVEARPMLPALMDPSGTGEDFTARWDQDGYANFRKWMIHYATKIDAAYLEKSRDASLALWQEVFGDKFQAPKQLGQSAAGAAKQASAVVSFRDTEQSLEDISIGTRLNPRYAVRLSGRVLPRSGFRDYYLAKHGNQVAVGRRIRFTIEKCNVPEPYDIYWKVKNNGVEAEKNDCLRGQIVKGFGTWRQDEPTAFRGPHYVECYIVKDGVCVALDRQQVLIR